MKQTQADRILAVLESLRDDTHQIPEEFIRRHPSGDGVSARYFKQVMLISECNGRISELRAKGYIIDTSKVKDAYGFAYHRLASSAETKPTPPCERTTEEWEQVGRELCAWFDNYQPETNATV